MTRWEVNGQLLSTSIYTVGTIHFSDKQPAKREREGQRERDRDRAGLLKFICEYPVERVLIDNCYPY